MSCQPICLTLFFRKFELFKNILNAFVSRRANDAIERSPILRAALFRSSAAFASTGLKDFSEKVKIDMSEELLNCLTDIVYSKDRVDRCRYFFVSAVVEFCKYQVLVLPPMPEDDETGLRGTQGVSGELKPLLLDICQKNAQIKEVMYGLVDNPTYGDVWDTVLVHYWKWWWWTETLNVCRIEMGDSNPIKENDWNRPFIHAMCVFSEDGFRRDLGMPPGPGIVEPSLAPLQYSTFVNFVLNGERFPDLAWRTYYKESIDGNVLCPPY